MKLSEKNVSRVVVSAEEGASDQIIAKPAFPTVIAQAADAAQVAEAHENTTVTEQAQTVSTLPVQVIALVPANMPGFPNIASQ